MVSLQKKISLIATRIAYAFLVIVVVASLEAGTVGKWKSYTSKKEIRGVAVVENTAWAVTSGGLFSYNQTNGAIEQFTTSEGLKTTDLTAILPDNNGNLWIGASNGILQKYDPVDNTWMTITGISSLSDEPNKSINAFKLSGDTLYVLSDLGVSIFSLSKLEFGDTYKKYGTGASQRNGHAVDLVRFQNSYWVATTSGIATTPLTTLNPSDPTTWQVITSGLPSTTVRSLAVFHDTLFAATASGVAWFNGTIWQTLLQTSGNDISALSNEFNQGTPLAQALYFGTGTDLWRYDGNASGAIVTGFPSAITSLAPHAIVGMASSGIAIDTSSILNGTGTQWKQIIPSGSPVNGLLGLAVDAKGVLWGGTGTTNSAGFTSFDGTTWKVYLPETLPQLQNARNAYIIDIGANNSKWISMYGEGVVQLDAKNNVQNLFNTTNGLSYTKNTATPPNTSFVVVTGVVTDVNGDVWIDVRGAIDRNLVAIYTPSTQAFRYLNYPVDQSLPNLTNIIQDEYGTKWFTTLSIPGAQEYSPGLVFYDPTLSMARRFNSGTGWGAISKDVDGLTDNDVTALAIDLDGSLWVGTNTGGINIIADPSVPYQLLLYHPLQGVKINDILVDPLNQKWVATEQGVFLLSSDGTSVLDSLTVKTTDGKLPHDHVESLAMNRETGTIYFGTEDGLASLTTDAVNPKSSFDGLKIYPNPYLLPSSGELTIDGLVEGSSIKILSISGNLIKEIVSPGGRVGFWDGTDTNGNMVSSGIYIVTAYSKDGSAVGNGKVAVVRK